LTDRRVNASYSVSFLLLVLLLLLLIIIEYCHNLLICSDRVMKTLRGHYVVLRDVVEVVAETVLSCLMAVQSKPAGLCPTTLCCGVEH